MEANNTPKKRSKLARLIVSPLKLLIKARDFYISGMNEYSDRIGYASVMGCPTGQMPVNSLPRSYSVSSSKSSNNKEDYSELLRAASARGYYGDRTRLDRVRRQQTTDFRGSNTQNMPRSFSVGIGRIDEDKPCEFEGEIMVKNDVFPRSRSYAVGNRRTSY